MGLCPLKYIGAGMFCFICLFFAGSDGIENSIDSTRILYLIQTGNNSKAFQLYREQAKAIGSHDFKLLQQMAAILLDQGFRSSDEEVQLLTLFGAGMSLNEEMLYVLDGAIGSSSPILQITSLNLLSRHQNDSTDIAFTRAMASNYLLIRLETAFILAEKKSPKAVSQIEGLMTKLDPELFVFFPDLYALIGSPDAIKVLRRLLNHSIEDVRVKAILSVGKYKRDDLLPKIRMLATHHETAQQEACAWTLGMMKDESSFNKLQQLSCSTIPAVRLAALQAQYRLGRKQIRKEIEEMALKNNIFAIEALGEMEGSEEVLFSLCQSENIHVRINAGLALLERQDSRCLPVLKEILIKNSKDIGFIKTFSQGKALSAWKAVPSSAHNFKDTPMAHELSLSLRESVLAKTVELKELDFIQIANLIFEMNQNDLIPSLVDLLENHQTPAAIALLKKHQQKAGAPLIRNYCNLALYLLQEPGPYADNLSSWILKQRDEDLIRFRPFMTWDLREEVFEHTMPYQLTPQDTSTLLIKSFEAFLKTRDDKGIDILLESIQNGNPKNKYALAGLLMRAIQ